MVLAPVPDRERRVAVELERDRPVPEGAQRVDGATARAGGSRTRAPSRRRTRRRTADTAPAEGPTGTSARAARRSARRTSSTRRARWRHPGRRVRRPARSPRRAAPGMIASFVFEIIAYAVNGYAAHAKARSAPSRAPPKRTPTRPRPDEREEVERDRGRVRGGQLVPPPGPAEDEHGGHVGEIGDRPVRVAARIRRLAAAVRLDPVAYLAVGVGPAAGLQVVRHRHRPVRRLAVEDPVAADHAGVADVDHAAAVVDVEPDAESDEEERGDGERPDGPDGVGRPRPCGRPEADPCASASQVDERRYASGTLVKTSPRSKKTSETLNESSARRSSVRSDSGRRRSARPTKKIAQRPDPHRPEVRSVPPKRPAGRGPSSTPPAARSTPRPRDRRSSATVPVAISPASPDQTWTVHVRTRGRTWRPSGASAGSGRASARPSDT